MSKRLFLHIGTHKTATTTVQHFFSKNRKALRHAGIYYPSQDIVGLPKHYAHHRIAHGIAGKNDLVDLEKAKVFFERASERLTDGEVAFVSAEPFYRHLMASEGEGGRNIDDEYRAYIARVKEVTASFDVRIVAMVRRQDLFAESLYSEHVLATSYKKKINAFIEEKSSLFDYEARLGLWAQEFGKENILLKTFEREAMDHPIERVFVDWLGGRWSDDFESVGEFNPSLNRSFVEFKRRINLKGQPQDINTQLRAWLTEASKKPFVDAITLRQSYYLGPKERYEWMAKFGEGNANLARDYLGRENLFVRPLEDDVKKYKHVEDLSDDEFQTISKNMFRMIARRVIDDR